MWSVPAGSKLTEEQMASFKAGNLYVNVHSAEHKPGEIRAHRVTSGPAWKVEAMRSYQRETLGKTSSRASKVKA